MKNNLFLASIALIWGTSCQQPVGESNNSTNNNNDIELQQQDSLLAISIHESDIRKQDTSWSFGQSFLTFLEKNPNSINFDFPKLVDVGMKIATSTDSIFRIYSWDDNEGGSMRFFNNIFQVSLPNGQLVNYRTTDDERVFYPFYTQITSIQLDGQLYYLAFARSILSNKEVNYAVEIYKVDGDQLKTVDLFKIDNGVDYRLDKVFNYEELGEPDKELIKFDASNLTFTLPEVMQDGSFSNKTITYQYENNYFQKK